MKYGLDLIGTVDKETYELLQQRLGHIESEIEKIKRQLGDTKLYKIPPTEKKLLRQKFKRRLKELEKERKRIKSQILILKMAHIQVPIISKLLKRKLIGESLIPIVVSIILLRILGIDELIASSFGIIPSIISLFYHHPLSERMVYILSLLEYIIFDGILSYILIRTFTVTLYKLPIHVIKLTQLGAMALIIFLFFAIGFGL
jgi:hypothetical protein